MVIVPSNVSSSFPCAGFSKPQYPIRQKAVSALRGGRRTGAEQAGRRIGGRRQLGLHAGGGAGDTTPLMRGVQVEWFGDGSEQRWARLILPEAEDNAIRSRGWHM